MMNNIKKAKVLHINSLNEEHVTLLIDGHTIECFANSCPYAIEIGKEYEVEIAMNLSDSYEVERTPHTKVLFEKTTEGYGYFLYGTLKNDTFLSFTDLNDEDIHYDHPELNDHFIRLQANRIDVNFL